MSSVAFDIAEDLLIKSSGLNESKLQSLMKRMTTRHVDDADLYFQSSAYESWYLEDGAVKSGRYALDRGVGLRVVSGEKTGYAYCDDIEWSAMERAAQVATSIAHVGSINQSAIKMKRSIPALYAPLNPIDGMSKLDKIALLQSVDKAARLLDPRVVQVHASLSGCYEVIYIAGLHGLRVADVRPLVRMDVTVMVESKGRRESAHVGGGGRCGYEFFLMQDKALGLAQEAVRQALVNLEAIDAPAGLMPVVLGPGWPAVLLHEAVGHGLEGDANRKGVSTFSGCLGQQVASKGVNVVDDGTLISRRGSLTIDDEGTPTACTSLIEDGILVNYMQDKLNAKLMGMKSTGNCRRESYAHVPMPRMTNTYMLAGSYAPEEIIQSVKRGIYAVNFGGGQVDITSGQFVFSASEAYLIENGRVMQPIKGATLIGNGPDIMKKISMVGNNLAFDEGVGICGKEGQSVPVGVGQPTLKIEAMTVGGTR